MLERILQYRALWLVLLIYALVLLLPQQSLEVLRCALSSTASWIIWTVLWPVTLFAMVLGLSATFILESEPWGQSARWRIAAIAAIPFVITAGAVLLAVVGQPQSTKWLAIIVASSAAAAGLSLAVIAYGLAPLAAGHVTRAGYWILFSILFVVLFAGLYVPMRPELMVSVARTAGPLALVAIFCSTLAAALSYLTQALQPFRFPILTAILLYALVLNFSEINNNHQIRTLDSASTVGLPLIEGAALQTWIEARKDRPKYGSNSYPVFVVAAQGGGAYAAYHVATVLSRLNDQWPEFGEHVFAVSSVSGGSVGVSLFAALLRDISDPSVACEGAPHPKMTKLIDRFFADDHLSPLMLMGLFPDFVQRFLPFRVNGFDRALGLEYSLEQSWDDLAKACNLKGPNPFRESIRSFDWSANATPNVPALFFNTTDVMTGGPVVVSTADFGGFLFKPVWRMGFENDMRLSTAAVLSSRFPIVTASGWFTGATINDYGERAGDKTVYLDDGGIYENSATELLGKLMYQLRYLDANIDPKVTIYAVVVGDSGYTSDEFKIEMASLRGDPTGRSYAEQLTTRLKVVANEQAPPIAGHWWSDIDSPLGALLQSRQFRSRESVKMTLRLAGQNPWKADAYTPPTPEFNVINNNSFVFPLDAETPDMPLGWMLSKTTLDRLGARSGRQDDCFVTVPFPSPGASVIANQLVEYMQSSGENLTGAINNFQANCSQKAILATRQ